jgi:hypothetical protein
VTTALTGRPVQGRPGPARRPSGRTVPGRPSAGPSGRASDPINRGKHHPWPAELGRPDTTAINLRYHPGNGAQQRPAQVAITRGNDWPVLLDSTEMTVALHRSGVTFRGTETPQDVAAAILTGIERDGTDTIREAACAVVDAGRRLAADGETTWYGHKNRAALLGGYRRENLLLALARSVLAAAER